MGSGAVELATRKANGMVRFCEGWCGARGCSNPSVLTAKRFGDKKGVDMQLKRNKATVCALPSIHLPLTREASVMAIFEGLLSFCNCCGNGSIRCNGRSKLAPLRKARGIVRFLEGLVRGEGWCGNSSGSRPNFFGDSTSPLTRGGKNVVRSEGGLAIPPVVARIFSGDSTSPLTREARVLVVFEGWCGFGRVGCGMRDC